MKLSGIFKIPEVNRFGSIKQEWQLTGIIFLIFLWLSHRYLQIGSYNERLILAGTSPFIYINLGKDEPGMILQRREGREWCDYQVEGKPVKAPIKIDSLPPGRY